MDNQILKACIIISRFCIRHLSILISGTLVIFLLYSYTQRSVSDFSESL